MGKGCTHIDSVAQILSPQQPACSECVKIGASWVHLRTCQTCGITLCCDSSEHRHARRHTQQTGHPVIASAEPGEYWLYCYVDDAYARYEPDSMRRP